MSNRSCLAENNCPSSFFQDHTSLFALNSTIFNLLCHVIYSTNSNFHQFFH
ncbi:hypothetical protein HanXRQr2_Chr10g0441321 [Helianthus annuus]|uniref:Uncharacterized protein n=1 Tax=Helianthus annuus TaxID=4232 RepID=A0A9K3N3Y2_HELAN|nr:hypothetical protein HanXRQr2_Chr10g0441321 [Helianthus annuus]